MIARHVPGPQTAIRFGRAPEIHLARILLLRHAPRRIGLDNPHTAMVYGGTMGTNSGVMAGLAATDPKLVPYGAMTATFYTGLGCLLGPSFFYLVIRCLAI